MNIQQSSVSWRTNHVWWPTSAVSPPWWYSERHLLCNPSYGCLSTVPMVQCMVTPKQAIQSAWKNNDMSTIARKITAGKLEMGKSTSIAYKAFLLDTQKSHSVYEDRYEILLVGDGCITVWVPYSVGDPIPDAAMIAWKDEVAGTHYYVVSSRDTTYMVFTFYAGGSNNAYYRHIGGVPTMTDMYVFAFFVYFALFIVQIKNTTSETRFNICTYLVNPFQYFFRYRA